jgi:hypothetical protein
MLVAWHHNHAPAVSLQLWIVSEADSIIKPMKLWQRSQRFKVTI